jgi:hypothetical protein
MEQYFYSLAALVPLIILITDFIIRLLPIKTSPAKQMLSWAVSVLICLAAAWVDIGIFAEMPIWETLIYAFCTGLVANGVFDIGMVQVFLDFVLKFLPTKLK